MAAVETKVRPEGTVLVREPVASSAADDEAAVDLFKRYLRMKTVSADDNYTEAVGMIKEWAEALSFTFETVEIVPDCPCVFVKWEGTDPGLPSLVLNSHMDVVPVEADKWTVDPWGGVEKDGKIYGRGAQDMKSVGIQYMVAVERLYKSGFKPKRSVHLLFVPDEELSGKKGMQQLTSHPKLAEMNCGLVLDEGLASEGDTYKVFYGERKPWWVHVTATGPAGHGSRLIEGTAVEKLMVVANRLLAFRQHQLEELKAGCACGKSLGDVTTVNLTTLKAGVIEAEHDLTAYNVIPTEAEAGFDIRIPATRNLVEFKALLDTWTAEEGVSYELVAGTDRAATSNPTTDLTPENEWWQVFKGAMEGAGHKIDTGIFPAATDSRFLRMLNIPAFGFSPMRNTPILLHDHDEHVPRDVFLEGINVYTQLIPALTEATLSKAYDVGFNGSAGAGSS